MVTQRNEKTDVESGRMNNNASLRIGVPEKIIIEFTASAINNQTIKGIAKSAICIFMLSSLSASADSITINEINQKISTISSKPSLTEIAYDTSWSRENLADVLKKYLDEAGVTLADFKNAHYERNRLQSSIVEFSDVFDETRATTINGYIELPAEKSVFHRIGIENFNNRKFISSDGKSEYVFTRQKDKYGTVGWAVVSNAVNTGTYNFFGPTTSKNERLHVIFDVIPWILWGNNTGDDTSFDWRLQMYENAGSALIIHNKTGYPVTNITKLSNLYDLMDDCNCTTRNPPQESIFYYYNTYVPAPTATGFINDPFSLTNSPTQPTLVSNYATNPDLTDELQQDIIDAAEPTDPPIEGLWAGRMSLSGHFISGTNAENSGPVTGVVTAMEASGEAPLSDFILFRPEQGSMTNPIQGVQTAASIGHSFTHLMWGSWTGGPRSWTDDGSRFGDLSGFFVYGELTPPTARSSGVASYTGRLRGDVIEEGGVIQSGLAYGDFGLTANFGTGALGGWLAIAADNSTNYVFVSDISNANIVRQSDNLHFYGDIGTNLQEGMGHIEGYFFGANATELGGTYELSSSVGGSTHGILLGWETGTMPTKPVFADGSKRAHISTQMPDGYILDSSLDILTVPAQGQPSVALAVPQEQGGGTVSTSQVYAQNGYSYTSWGKWRANDSTPDSYSNGGYWAAGDATSGSAIQNKTGSATYSGEIIGDHVSNGVRQAAEGSIHLTADFNADRISGDMEFHTETTSMTPAPIDAAIQDSGYFGQIGNDSANGNFGFGVQGNFFGPNADEVGGSAWASTDEGTYNGVFRAKQ